MTNGFGRSYAIADLVHRFGKKHCGGGSRVVVAVITLVVVRVPLRGLWGCSSGMI